MYLYLLSSRCVGITDKKKGYRNNTGLDFCLWDP